MTLRRVAPCIFAVALSIGTVKLAISQSVDSQNPHPGRRPAAYVVTLLANGPSALAPVEIVRVLLGDQAVPINSPFAARGNWVSKIHIIVRNTSRRTIVSGSATLVFPETGDGTPEHPLISAGMGLGRPPATAYRQKDGTVIPLPNALARRDPIAVLPGQTMEFHFKTYPNGMVSGDSAQAEAYRMAKISRVRIDLRDFYFADGSKWTGSIYLEPVNAPSVWKQIPADQFLSTSETAPQ